MTNSNSSIVLVMDKHQAARWLAPLITDKWPGRRVFAILTYYVGVYEFRYPRGLKMSDFPFVGEPAWKIRDMLGLPHYPALELIDGQLINSELSALDLLRDNSEIWYAGDLSHSGANAFDVLMAESLGVNISATAFPAIFIRALDSESLISAIDAGSSTDSPKFRECVAKGKAKRFFEFNFNTNSMAVFGDRLRKVGVDTDKFEIGKNSLQVLYWMRAQEGVETYSEGKLVMAMYGWKGTGRYEQCEMGSPASQSLIVSSLTRSGLLARQGREIFISDLGHAFLRLLHPDCEDQDLPARLHGWQADWPNSKPKIERYIRTLFGKQLRFNQTHH